jgi:hypothetical protein
VIALVKLTGYYQLPGTLPQPVDFEDLFDKSFMRKHTNYRTFEKFLQGGKFYITSQQDFEALPEEQMDKHVVKATRLGSWKEMIDFATDIYARRQMQR